MFIQNIYNQIHYLFFYVIIHALYNYLKKNHQYFTKFITNLRTYLISNSLNYYNLCAYCKEILMLYTMNIKQNVFFIKNTWKLYEISSVTQVVIKKKN
jgi:hypothetical protein